MRLAVAMAAVAAAAAQLVVLPAVGQSPLDGTWYGLLTMPDGGQVEVSTVILGNSYTSNAQSDVQTTAGIYRYVSAQSGEVVFTPPDHLELVVLDWNPKSTPFFPVYPPSNGNYTIVSLGAQQLVVVDSICVMTMNATAQQCTFTFQKVQ